MRLTKASTKPSKLPGALSNPRKSSATPNSLRQSAAKCRFMRLACPIALLELIARLGSSQNKILLWRAWLTMIIFYDLRCTEQSQIRFSDAQFWKSLARLSRQLAVSGIIRRLALPLECIPRAFSGVRRQGEFVISCGFRSCGDDGAAEVRTDV